jgi:hypothetical protein
MQHESILRTVLAPLQEVDRPKTLNKTTKLEKFRQNELLVREMNLMIKMVSSYS